MGLIQAWKASAILSDNSELLLCQADSQEYVRRWCRRLLKEWSAEERSRVKSIKLYRGEEGQILSWHRDQEFLPPFTELLSSRRNLLGRTPAPVLQPRPLRGKPIPHTPSVEETVTAFVEPKTVQTTPADPALTARYGLLLTWLSAAGAGSWPTFVYACQALSLARTGSEAGRIVRRLVLLGHLGQSESGKRWWVVSPTLTPLADDPERYFLRGQRTPALVARLPIAHEETAQPDCVGPLRLTLCLDASNDATAQVGPSRFTIEPHGAGARAEMLPTWEEWLARMPAVGGLVLTKFRRERWENSAWTEVSGTLFEDENHTIRGESGMYRLSREEPFLTRVSVFFDASGQKFVRGDWYGLRFLARHFQKLPLTASWRADQQCLVIPSEERWPLAYEQVLIQASGLLPSRTGKGPLSYQHVPESLARHLCGKLEVQLDVTNAKVGNRQLLLFS